MVLHSLFQALLWGLPGVPPTRLSRPKDSGKHDIHTYLDNFFGQEYRPQPQEIGDLTRSEV